MKDRSSDDGILKSLVRDGLVVAVLAIVMGLVFVIVPATSGAVISVISGILLVGAGGVALAGAFIYGPLLAGYSMAMGFPLILGGLICIVQPHMVMGIMTIIFGAFIAFDAGVSLIDGIHCLRCKVSGGAALTAISAILLLLGIFVILGPAETSVVILGWALILDGIFDIVAVKVFGKKIKEARRSFRDDDVIDIGER